MARHRESQANVRSTTQRRAEWVFPPCSSRFSSPVRRGFYWGNVGHIACCQNDGFGRRISVAFVEAQMLRLLGGRLGPFHDDSVERQGKQISVWRVGSADAGCKGPAIAFDTQ